MRRRVGRVGRETNILMESRGAERDPVGAKHMEGTCIKAKLTRARGSENSLEDYQGWGVRGGLHWAEGRTKRQTHQAVSMNRQETSVEKDHACKWARTNDWRVGRLGSRETDEAALICPGYCMQALGNTGISPNFSVTLFLHLYNGNDNYIYLTIVQWSGSFLDPTCEFVSPTPRTDFPKMFNGSFPRTFQISVQMIPHKEKPLLTTKLRIEIYSSATV